MPVRKLWTGIRIVPQLARIALKANPNSKPVISSLNKRDATYKALKEPALQQGGEKAKASEKNCHTWITFEGHRETGEPYVIKCVDV